MDTLIPQKLPAIRRMWVIVSAKKTYFHGVRLHSLAARRSGYSADSARTSGSEKPQPTILQSVRDQEIYLPNTTLIGDKAFPDS